MESVSKLLSSNVQDSFRELAKTAKQLNFASDALGKYVGEIEKALRALNLGVAGWVTIESFSDENGLSTLNRELGFDKIGKQWSIGLQSYVQPEWDSQWTHHEEWVFDEAPRAMRIKAIEHLPELIQELNKNAAAIAKSTAEKLPTANNLASQISSLVEAGEGKKPEVKK
jgi:hypothetical protein